MDEIDLFLQEDLSIIGDITSNALFSNEKGKASIIAKEKCVIAGLEEASKIFKRLGVDAEILVKDGNWIKKGKEAMIIKGKIRSILAGERLALNFICRMSGIATLTKQLVEKCRKINPTIVIAATRKTTPGFRKYEKKAVVIGGGDPHRFGLYDAILIKDNHLACVGMEDAIKRAKIKNRKIEIEVENEENALKAAKMGVDEIMLDNIPPKKGKEIAKKIKEINPSILIEVSGGITPENIAEYIYADRISLGWLTHSVKSADFSLEIKG